MTGRINQSLMYIILLLVTGLSLVLVNCGGDDPNGPTDPPVITTFSANPSSNLARGDSTLITWGVRDADSVILMPNNRPLTPADSGQEWLFPLAPTTYTITAYNDNGLDTASAQVAWTAVSVDPVNGLIYRGEMGSSNLDRQLIFRVVDGSGQLLPGEVLSYRIRQGDGTLSPTSGVGQDTLSYTFDGALGYAVVEAAAPGFDTVEVAIRANRPLPGPNGQGQYVLFSETYQEVLDWNGPPEAIDVDPNCYFNYAVYETSKEVVFLIEDSNFDGLTTPDEQVLGCIFTSGYPYDTPDGIGIGSHLNDLAAVYGAPDTSFTDPTPPAALVYLYGVGPEDTTIFIDNPPRMTFFANPSDSVIFEMHLLQGSPCTIAPGLAAKPSNGRTNRDRSGSYRSAIVD